MNHCFGNVNKASFKQKIGSYNWNSFQDEYQLCGSGGKAVTHQSVSGLIPGPCNLHIEVSFIKIPKILVHYLS